MPMMSLKYETLQSSIIPGHRGVPTVLDEVFLSQLQDGVKGATLSTWSPLNRIAFASTYQLKTHPHLDGWVTGTLRSGSSFASPIHSNDLHSLDTVVRALASTELVGPYDQVEIKKVEHELPVHSICHRADSDYILNCDLLLLAEGSSFSRWRRYMRVAERSKLRRMAISKVTTSDLEILLDEWGNEHGVSGDRTFDIKEMTECFDLRKHHSNIAGFGYYLHDRLVGVTICDLSVEGVVNLLFMKTSKSVLFLSRLAIRDIAAEFGNGALLNMGQDLNISGLRKFKASLPTSEIARKFYIRY